MQRVAGPTMSAPRRFRSLIPSYIRDSSVAVVVFDVTSVDSFEATSKWISDVRTERGDGVVIALVGNKVDVETRAVSQQELQQFADEEKVLCFETSAKTGEGVKDLFKSLAAKLPEKGGAAAATGTGNETISVNAAGQEQAEASVSGGGCPC